MLAIRSPVLKLRNHAVAPGGSGAVAVQVSLLLTREACVSVQALDPVIPESVVDTSTALSNGFADEKEAFTIPLFMETSFWLHQGLLVFTTDFAKA